MFVLLFPRTDTTQLHISYMYGEKNKLGYFNKANIKTDGYNLVD